MGERGVSEVAPGALSASGGAPADPADDAHVHAEAPAATAGRFRADAGLAEDAHVHARMFMAEHGLDALGLAAAQAPADVAFARGVAG